MDYKAGEILYINKPLEWSSFKLVRAIRWMISRKLGVKKFKIGHAGTLDPLATGVMILCTGKATKRIEEFQYRVKEYEAVLCLGATTPSFDRETEVDAIYPYEHLTEDKVKQVLTQFIGEIDQVPPAFSAVRVNGRRAYQYARKGIEVEIKSKKLVVDEIELLSFQPQEIKIRVVCSKGTYIRALARDIGQALDSGAHLTALCRTRIGDKSLSDCMSYDEAIQMIETTELTAIEV